MTETKTATEFDLLLAAETRWMAYRNAQAAQATDEAYLPVPGARELTAMRPGAYR